MGIQIFDKKQSVIYVPDNDNESKAKGATVGRHLEKAKKHCSKYNKYAELLESNNMMKPYYEIYECKKFN